MGDLTFVYAGFGKAATSNLARVLARDATPMKWTGPTARALDARFNEEKMKRVVVKTHWRRLNGWVDDFLGFVRVLEMEEPSVGEPLSERAALGDDRLCYLYLNRVDNERKQGSAKGFSRLRSARRFLSVQRIRFGQPSLVGVVKIDDLIKAADRATPRTVVQREAMDFEQAAIIVGIWGQSNIWYQVEIATMVGVGFMTIMRIGELRQLLLAGVRIRIDGEADQKFQMSTAWIEDLIKRSDDVIGILFHLKYRKSTQSSDAWLPVGCPTTILLFLRWLRLRIIMYGAGGDTVNGFVFPSKSRRKIDGEHRISRRNPIGDDAAREGIRAALVACCGVEQDEVRRYTGYSLRVGGSAHMRNIGISDDIHRKMGGWCSLTSSARYMQMKTADQFETTKKWAVNVDVKRGSGLSTRETIRAVGNLRRLTFDSYE